MRTAPWLLVAIGVLGVSGTSPAVVLDQSCSKIKSTDVLPKVGYSAFLTPPGAGCTFKTPPKMVCSSLFPAIGEGQRTFFISPFLCYKVKCPKSETSLTLQDSHGTHHVTVKAPTLLCAPATVPPP